MYKYLFILLFLTSCGDSSSVTKQPSVHDTTVVVYAMDIPRNKYEVSLAAMYIYDTLLPDPKDNTKNILRRDTSYQVPLFFPAVDSITKRPLYKIDGQDSGIFKWLNLPKQFLVKNLNYKIPQ